MEIDTLELNSKSENLLCFRDILEMVIVPSEVPYFPVYKATGRIRRPPDSTVFLQILRNTHCIERPPF